MKNIFNMLNKGIFKLISVNSLPLIQYKTIVSINRYLVFLSAFIWLLANVFCYKYIDMLFTMYKNTELFTFLIFFISISPIVFVPLKYLIFGSRLLDYCFSAISFTEKSISREDYVIFKPIKFIDWLVLTIVIIDVLLSMIFSFLLFPFFISINQFLWSV